MIEIPVTASGFDTTRLLGHSHRALAIVVDPPADPGPWVRACELRDLRIRHVIVTGQVSTNLLGFQLLAKHTGAQLYAPDSLKLSDPHLPLRAGDVLEFGGMRITARDADDGALRLEIVNERNTTPRHAENFGSNALR